MLELVIQAVEIHQKQGIMIETQLTSESIEEVPVRKAPFQQQTQKEDKGFSMISAILLITAFVVASTLTILLVQGSTS